MSEAQKPVNDAYRNNWDAIWGKKEKDMQRFDWAYGNLAASTNHKPSRKAFLKLFLDEGYSEADFEEFARDKVWVNE